MSLSIYDPKKGCFVLNPANFAINAFHKDYVKTYMPEFLTQAPAAKPVRKHVALAPTAFKVFSDAGMPKTVKKVKMKGKETRGRKPK
jgi:hypothetical protein